jgi:predicted nucleotide-binding protein (sugar kinase/HSP70/actin superfamily)
MNETNRKNDSEEEIKSFVSNYKKKEYILHAWQKKAIDYFFKNNGKIIIERYNPDFIQCNGKKKIIELFGEYWHNI